MQPAEPETEPQLEEPGDSREPSVEPSLESRLDRQSEPTVTFLFTLLNTPEPKDAESDTETLESRFVSQEDWGPKRTSKEIQDLQRDCERLQEALNANQKDNLALEEKLQNLPTSLYKNLEGTLLTLKNFRLSQETAEVSQEEAKDTQEEAEDTQEEAEDTQEEAEDTQEEAGVTQEETGVTQEEAGVTREEAEDTQKVTLALKQLKRASAQRFSLEPPISLPAATLFPEDSVSQQQQPALASAEARELILPQESVVSPSLSPSNKEPH